MEAKLKANAGTGAEVADEPESPADPGSGGSGSDAGPDPRPSAPKPGAPRREARRRVLAAALDAIAERGPDAVRVRDIAERAGMSAGHVLYYFGKRERILIETLVLSEEDLAEDRSARLARCRDPWSAVVRFIDLYLPHEPGDARWSLWTQMYARPPQDPDARARLAAVDAGWEADLAAQVRRGRDAGRFPGADPDDFAFRTCKTLDGLALEIMLGHPQRDSRWARRTAERIVRRELLPAQES
ncbi:TetR/AcrR family transcriptional regulator [Actinospica durhamensis]|uniref:TetR/AcrR family transcriptional regulator n=1 Tax=Actinospica durhamensis TaxID=1508375 RepID=A0A941ETU0_9ACTN|nr:TetR/AcrR family transcriptional regulator [Actinospica durhamensis]MBR7836916.1 TetR/AcrR family transcriptional regulator [Actinospica durhamensis]